MSFRQHIKELSEKRKTIDELKQIVLEESKENIKIFSSLNINSFEDVIKLYIDIGNVSFFNGNFSLFNYFIESSFQIINEKSNTFIEEELIKNVYYLGIISIRNYNANPFYIILNNLKQKILNLNEVETVNYYLNIFKDLALKCELNNFEIGFQKIIDNFKDIDEYFLEKNMGVNRFYLKNIIVSLISSTEVNKSSYIQDKIKNNSNYIFNQI